VESFAPATPTIFIRVARAAYRMRELHDKLNAGPLACAEEFPYMPHLTIVKVTTAEQAEQAYTMARERWEHFNGNRKIEIKELSFVREQEKGWVDLAGVPLGRRLATPKSR
jgi:2'-5' RNA ligase